MRNRSSSQTREDHELPNTTNGIISVVSKILSQPGKVFKIIIESGRGIIVYRESDTPKDLAEEGVTLDAALRNSEIVEYENDGASQFEKLHDMFYIMSHDRMHPVAWATGMDQDNILNRWLTMSDRGLPTTADPTGNEYILGIPLIRIQTLPEDVLILCGSQVKEADYQDVVVGIKTTMEIKDESRAEEPEAELSEVDSGVRAGEERAAPAASKLGTAPGRPGGAGWNPQDFFGVWVEDSVRVRKGPGKSHRHRS